MKAGLTNIILILYVLWIVVYCLFGMPEQWELIYFNIESLFMGAMPILIISDYSRVKKWLALQVSIYLFFRVLFINMLFVFPKLAWMNDNVWIMRSIGLIMLSVLIVNRKR